MPISIKDKKDCTGCGACLNACPKDCIKMHTDEFGFLYPNIDISKCINCDKCQNVCPILKNEIKQLNKIPEVYAAWSKNEKVRYYSTSGGIFSEIAYSILRQGGKVVGAAYNNENMVEHIIIDSYSGVEKLRQSKYIQSKVGFIYRLIKKELNAGEYILFVGSPCQVAGLKKYLKTDFDNLITVDFICRGMNSTKAYRYWLNEIEKKYNSKVKQVWFKYKKFGWKDSPMCTKVTMENGKEYITHSEKNFFMRGYLEKNLYLRPSCSKCQFKGIDRESDITIADFWKVPKEYDDNLGTSMVMINSNKGKFLFDTSKEKITFYKRDFNEILKGNVCFRQSPTLNPKGEEFLLRLGEKDFSRLISEYAPISYKKIIKEKLSRTKKKIKEIILRNA